MESRKQGPNNNNKKGGKRNSQNGGRGNGRCRKPPGEHPDQTRSRGQRSPVGRFPYNNKMELIDYLICLII